jgi:hypothetical protein
MHQCKWEEEARLGDKFINQEETVFHEIEDKTILI